MEESTTEGKSRYYSLLPVSLPLPPPSLQLVSVQIKLGQTGTKTLWGTRNMCDKGCSKGRLFWKAWVFSHPPFHRDQCTGGKHGIRDNPRYSTSYCILQASWVLQEKTQTKPKTQKTPKPKTKAGESGKVCLQTPLRTGSMSKLGLVDSGNSSYGDTPAFQSTHWDYGRDGAADWDCELGFSLYLGLEKVFPSLQVPVQCTLGCGLVYAYPAKAAPVQGN